MQTHRLHRLTVNGRQPLPATLLVCLRRAELDSPEALQALSGALLAAAEGMLAPLPRSSAPRRSPLSRGADAPASADFALGFVAVLCAIQDGAPQLITRDMDLSLASEQLLVRNNAIG